jgi:hypothetical protein
MRVVLGSSPRAPSHRRFSDCWRSLFRTSDLSLSVAWSAVAACARAGVGEGF